MRFEGGDYIALTSEHRATLTPLRGSFTMAALGRNRVAPARRTLVIVNPVAGGGRARRVQPHVADLLAKHDGHADFVVSTSTDDIRRIAAAAAAQRYEVLGVLGGDGAFHQAANGAFGTSLTLALFPAGNGNDIARGLGIPLDAAAAAHAFLRGRPRAVDLLRARFAEGRTHLYVAAGGMGLDAEAARLVNSRFARLPGATRYIAAALWSLRTFCPVPVAIELDGHRVAASPAPLLLAAVANGPWYGGGVAIAPDARMDDGMLDVTLVESLPLLRILEAVPMVLRGVLPRWAEIHRYRARHVSLHPLRGEPQRSSAFFHGDGEVLGQAPVEVEVVPRALRVISTP